MAKNSKGQTVSNKKYYKKDSDSKDKKKKSTTKKSTTSKTTKKTTPKKTTANKAVKKSAPKKTTTTKKTTPKKKTSTVKKTTAKKTTTKKTAPKKSTTKKTVVKKSTPKKQEVEKVVLDTNVSIKVDDKEEKLNYSIVDDVHTKAKGSSKIKSKFNDDLLDEVESESIVNEAFKEEESIINEEPIVVEEIVEEKKEEKREEQIERIIKIEEDKDSKEDEHIEEEIAYNGFIIRLIVLVLILILSIFFVIKFCVKYINNSPMKDVSYFESSDVTYSLCTGSDCNEDTIVSTSVDKVKVKFNYDVSFDDTVNLNVKYKVSEKLNIFNGSSAVKSNIKDILNKDIVKKKTDELNLEKELEVDLKPYREELNKYRNDNEGNFSGNVVISLFVDGVNDGKEVANIVVPLDEERLQTSIISSNVSDSLFVDDAMKSYGDLYVVLFIVSLLVVIGACIGVVVLINSSDIKGE